MKFHNGFKHFNHKKRTDNHHAEKISSKQIIKIKNNLSDPYYIY